MKEWVVLAFAVFSHATEAQVAVSIREAPAEGWSVARVSLTAELGNELAGIEGAARLTLASPKGSALEAFVIADPAAADAPQDDQRLGSDVSRVRGGTLVMHGASAREGLWQVRQLARAPQTPVTEAYEARSGAVTLSFAPNIQGGMPHQIVYRDPELTCSRFLWNDRVHHSERGGWLLRNDREPVVRILLETPELTVVRVQSRYCSEAGAPAPGAPAAVYDWYVLRQQPGGEAIEGPNVFVQAFIAQSSAMAWDELHHLEFNVQDATFGTWAGGEPLQQGTFEAARRGWAAPGWGALISGHAALAILAPEVKLYDGRGEYGTYVHGAWEAWSERRRRLAAWLWIGSDDDPAQAIARAAREPRRAQVVLTTAALDARIAQLSGSAKPPRTRWLASIADRLRASGDLGAAAKLIGADGPAPRVTNDGEWRLLTAGDAGLAVRVGAHGAQVASLFDLGRGRELAAPLQPPLLRCSLRRADGGESAELTSAEGWRDVKGHVRQGRLELRFADHSDARFKGISVTAAAVPERASASWAWSIQVDNSSNAWGIERVAFPQIAVEPPAPDAVGLYPTGPGVEHRLSKAAALHRSSLYPNGWCTMQFMAVYSAEARTGLYFGLHDPVASSKDIVMSSDGDGGVRLSFDVPAPHLGKAGVSYRLSGTAVWRLLRGDWYDAARIYRSWVTRHAQWYPKLGREGRTDTARWMKELSAWAQTGGHPHECVENVKAMQRILGVPIGFHWYNWHEIPFDNDYPHYFPTKPGVAEAVADLQQNDVYVMPYINGRLWDTRDRGAEDAEFSAVALPAATKHGDGTPVVETYGSKEADGTPVRLAVMCPTTPLWQSTVRDLVLRIMNEVGTKGVYIDQIAAAAPVLCMDATHGHPLGGGAWWTTAGYWPLLKAIRSQMPGDRMFTTECAAEPYTAMLDGYLTWDWQADGMVPALPAIYGGAVQYFGRNYAAGASTRDLALCMKMGQQLVFGEQIGWLDPRIAQEKVAGEFLRNVVRTRHRFVKYYASGEMARPPKLPSDIPSVRADWAWYGETWVTTPAVLTGAWRLPDERRLLLIFANVSDQPVRAAYQWDARGYGISAAKLTCVVGRDPDASPEPPGALPPRTRRILHLPRRSIETWEIRW